MPISEDILRVIHSRKSVRHFTGDKVPAPQLEILVRAGMAAPSAKDIRPWAFLIVRDEQILADLAGGLPFAKMLPSAGSAIVVCCDQARSAAGTHPEMWVQDCSAATQNILLAAEAMGLGAVWTACYPHAARYGHAAKILRLPPEIIPFNVIAIGFPTGGDLPKDKFDSSRIHQDGW